MNSQPGWQDTRKIEELRSTQRAALSFAAELPPMYAAWLLGRLCNELRFVLQMTWLRTADSRSERTSALWIALPRVARQAVENGSCQRVVEAIEQAENNWDTALRSEWHSDVIHQARVDLGNHLFHGSELKSGVSEIEWLTSLCAEPTEIIRQLEVQILPLLGEVPLLVHQLGHHVDQAIHPLMLSTIVAVERKVTGSLGWRERSPEARNPEVSSLMLPNRIVSPWPTAQWWQQTSDLIVHLNRSLDGQNGRNIICPSAEANLASSLTHLDRAIEQLDSRSADEGQDTGLSRCGESFLRSLGLNIHSSSRMVCCNEHPNVRCYLEPRLFNLFVFLANQRNEPTATRWIAENWGRFSTGRTVLPTEQVYPQIQRLNNLLSPCGVEATASGRRGYVLSRARPQN